MAAFSKTKMEQSASFPVKTRKLKYFQSSTWTLTWIKNCESQGTVNQWCGIKLTLINEGTKNPALCRASVELQGNCYTKSKMSRQAGGWTDRQNRITGAERSTRRLANRQVGWKVRKHRFRPSVWLSDHWVHSQMLSLYSKVTQLNPLVAQQTAHTWYLSVAGPEVISTRQNGATDGEEVLPQRAVCLSASYYATK